MTAEGHLSPYDDEPTDATKLPDVPPKPPAKCPECNGTGEVADGDEINDCDMCHGTGKEPQ